MRTINELRNFYQNTIIPQLDELEINRKKTVRKVVLTQLGLGVIFFSLFGAIILIEVRISLVYSLILAGWLIFGIIMYVNQTNSFVKGYKKNIIEKIIKYIDPELTYTADQGIPNDDFTDSQLFPFRIHSYFSDDLITGKVNGISFRFAEINAQHKVITGQHSQQMPVFKGIFYIARYSRNIQGTLFILQNVAKKTFGNKVGAFLQSKNIKRGSIIKVENQEYEKEYVTYSDVPETAQEILSDALIARFVDFYETRQKNLFLSIINDTVYLAIPNSKELFEPRLLRSFHQFTPVQDYFEEMQLGIDIIHFLTNQG